jgi:hypothetical protein
MCTLKAEVKAVAFSGHCHVLLCIEEPECTVCMKPQPFVLL